jgi:hypothetical protein
MGLIDDVGEDIWRTIEDLLPEKKKKRIARAMVEVLEEYETEDLEGTTLWDAAYPEDEEDEEDIEDDEDEDY